MLQLIGFLFVALSLVAIIIYDTFSWGYVLMVFWKWFIVPVFHFDLLTFYQAVGLVIFLHVIKAKPDSGLKKEYRNVNEALASSLLSPWITLICGWVVYALFIQ